MPVQVLVDTPLAEALNSAVQIKLMDAGLAQPTDAAALAEYIILMLVNGKEQDEIARELATDLLGLPADDPTASQFVTWLFEHAETLHIALSGLDNAADGMDQDLAADSEIDADMATGNSTEPQLNAPTGPRSMRNPSGPRGGRGKRMLGEMSRAMDRSSDALLHRTRGNDRINTHARGPPTGPRAAGRGGRAVNIRGAGMQAGMGPAGIMGGRPMDPNALPNMVNMGMNMNNGWGASGQQPGADNMDIVAIMQQQSQMMAQLQQMMSANNGGAGQKRGKSLFDRTRQPHRDGQRNRPFKSNDKSDAAHHDGGAGAEGEDVDMTKREPPNPEDTVCKYNLRCTNKDCKFAHQSPAAPPGTHVDVNDVCSFGAACKNRKCVGRHPSPSTKLAHQGEQDCKFFPNCHNPQCPFKHPDMPLCRNGASCTTPGCKFTHVKVKCRFNPCKNPHCAYTHEEGQQGVFKDKVWTPADGDHVSERKFVGEGQQDEVILPQDDHQMAPDIQSPHEIIT